MISVLKSSIFSEFTLTIGDMKVYPIHTFDPSGNTCYDQRLNVQEGTDQMTWTFKTFRADLT